MAHQTYKHFDFTTPWGVLRKRLKAKGWTNDELDDYRRQREDAVAQRAVNLAKTKRLRALQSEFFAPLRTEIRVVRSQLLYWTPERSEEHNKFYQAYARALDEVYSRIVWEFSRFQETPHEIAQRFDLPNKGVHWVDWVDWVGMTREEGTIHEWTDKIKRRYAKLPFSAGRRRKAILSRWTAEDHDRAKKKLLTATKKDYELLQRDTLIHATPEDRTKLERMKQAIDLIAKLSNEDAVPATWQGVLKHNDNWGEQ